MSATYIHLGAIALRNGRIDAALQNLQSALRTAETESERKAAQKLFEAIAKKG